MVGHSYSRQEEIKIFVLPVGHPVDRRAKKTQVGNTKVETSVFLFIDLRLFFVPNIQLLIFHLP